jgi:plastocyanin
MSQTHSVEIRQMKFRPATLEVKVGDTVQWTNKEGMAHTVTSDDGASFSSESLGLNQTFSFTADAPARAVSYHCEFHPGMKASLTITV